MLRLGREHVDDAPADGELSSGFDPVGPPVTQVGQSPRQVVDPDLVAGGQLTTTG
jgi:hypothetical protein